jgi:type II secretory pathway pseudopilin PulG
MRKFISVALCIFLPTAAFTWPQNQAPGVKNTFKDVTPYLEPGGSLYVYLNTEEWLNGLSTQVSQFRELVRAIPSQSPADQQNAARLFDLLAKLIKRSGIEEISGFGISGIRVEKGLYRSKSILYHDKGNDSGLLWSAFGRGPHALDGLDMLPANTVFASFTDLDLPLLWSILNSEIRQSGIHEAQQLVQTLQTEFAGATGVDLSNALASIAGECGVVVSLEETEGGNARLAGPSPQRPQFNLMLVCKVKNDVIFDAIDSKWKPNPRVIRTDRNGFRMRTMPSMPATSGGTRFSIARSGEYFFIASSDTLIETSVAAKSGTKAGLRATDEFKRLSQGIPGAGNFFSFRSQRLAETFARLQSQVLVGTPDVSTPQTQLMTSLFGAAGTYNVASNVADGWLSIANSGQNPATSLLLLPTIMTTAMIASIGLPNLLRSRQAANDSAAIANLRTINTAEVTYAATSGGNYGDLRALMSAGLLDSRFNGAVLGYQFDVNASGRNYFATATPLSSDAGRYGYYSTSDAVVRYSLVAAQAPTGQAGRPVQ